MPEETIWTKKLDKETISYLTIALLIFLILFFTAVYYLVNQVEKANYYPISQAQKESENIKGVLDSLTPKEVKPLTPEEQKEIEETLKSLTPPSQPSQPSVNQEEINAVLESLTPK